jgi:hypothetical protein
MSFKLQSVLPQIIHIQLKVLFLFRNFDLQTTFMRKNKQVFLVVD